MFINLGLKLKLRLGETQAFKKMGAHFSHRLLPDSNSMPDLLQDDDYLMEYVRHQTLTGHHACGTCSMGDVNDPNSVVDPQLRLVNIQSWV